MSNPPQIILDSFGLTGTSIQCEIVGGGLINSTWKISTPDDSYILQKINDNVFKNPKDISQNINLVGAYLKKKFPDYNFFPPLTTLNGNDLIHHQENGFFRMFPFVNDSHTINVVESPDQAYEAAQQFGRFTAHLSNFEVNKLKTTIPNFHNLPKRYEQFVNGIKFGNKQRAQQAKDAIDTLIANSSIISAYLNLIKKGELITRVIHHDTKISNVLFNSKGKGICVIDLDTVMPGFFISDVGDMMRTYLSASSEEEMDLSKIEIRTEFYDAIVEGYQSEMGSKLSDVEKKCFFFAGKYMIYMQALRFLTDFLLKNHNLFRAKNQIKLLDKFLSLNRIF